MPQRAQTRLRSSGRPGGSSAGWPQREQKRIGFGRPSPAGVHDRSIRIRAVTPGDCNTEGAAPPALRGECTSSGPNPVRNRRRYPVNDSERGDVLAVQQELWGSETSKAIENFPVSGERVPTPVVRWLGRIKAEAARVNAELGLLDAEIAERIAAAGDEVAAGQHDDQFPIDVFQTGSGHLLEHERQRGDREPRRRGRPRERPREHGAVVERRVPVGRAPGGGGHASRHELLPALEQLADSLSRQGRRVRGARQGRAHPHDGRRSGDARAGVRRLRGADQARARPRPRLPRAALRRSRWAAPPPAPG